MDKQKSAVLPPCRICGAASSGFHYGANTCEACKAFFRRSLTKHISYECAERKCCEVSFENRNACAYCRFQKCLGVGMCKDAIKTGRYSHEKRASNIREIRRLKMEVDGDSRDSPIDSTTLSLQRTSPSILPSSLDLGSPRLDFSSPQSTLGLSSPNSNLDLSSPPSNLDLSSPRSNFDFSSRSNLAFSSPRSTLDQLSSHSSDSNSEKSDVCSVADTDSGIQDDSVGTTKFSPAVDIVMETLEDCDKVDEPAGASKRQLLYDIMRVEYYDSTIKSLRDLHRVYALEELELGETLSEKESECLEMVELRKQVFGHIKPMSMEEYVKFYVETGIDLDDRREILEDRVLPNIEEGVKQYISFAKAIPGFNELCLSDQICLIKTSRMDFFLIGKHRLFNPKHKLFRPCEGKVIHVEDMMRVIGEAVEPFFNVQQKIRNLNLTKDETAIVCALCIMNTDSCDLQNKSLVEQSQDFILECLFYLFDKHHTEGNKRFSLIIDCLTELRTLREDNYKQEEQMVSIWWGLINFPPLLSEIWSS